MSAAVDDEIREQLLNALAILRPYARSHGKFVNLPDLRTAIGLAQHAIDRAELLANYRLPPTP
jgi:hypothetical protein